VKKAITIKIEEYVYEMAKARSKNAMRSMTSFIAEAIVEKSERIVLNQNRRMAGKHKKYD
jgi:uncharacterized protein (DUF1778 family)